jgi:hypothetical protein
MRWRQQFQDKGVVQKVEATNQSLGSGFVRDSRHDFAKSGATVAQAQ